MNDTKLNQIIEGCRRRERVAQHELYGLFYTFALSVGRRYVASTEEAREVVNDAFFRVFTKIENYSPGLPFQAWLRKIVVYSAIDHFRKYQRSSLPVEDLSKVELTAAADGTDMLEQLSSDGLLALVQQLPPAYRLAVNLFAVEGYEHREIAAMLGISEGTSKSNLFKARAKLKEMVLQPAPKITKG